MNSNIIPRLLLSLLTATYLLPTFAEITALRPIGSLSGGAAITDDAGASDHFPISVTHFEYDTDKETQSKGIFGGALGIEIEANKKFWWQTAIAYYQTTPFSVSGNQSQEFTPASTRDTFPYTYEIVSRQLLWENKFLWHWRKHVYPYFLVGIGAAFNTTQQYTVHHDTRTFTPEYKNKQNNSFTYSLGLGVDYTIHPRVRAGINYRFVDLGKTGLAEGVWETELASAPAPNFASQSHFYTQEILVQLTFLL